MAGRYVYENYISMSAVGYGVNLGEKTSKSSFIFLKLWLQVMLQPAVTNHGKLVVNYIAPGAIVGLNFNMAETNWINFILFIQSTGGIQTDFLHILLQR